MLRHIVALGADQRIRNSSDKENDSLNAQEQRELQSRMEKKQMKEFMNVSDKTGPGP